MDFEEFKEQFAEDVKNDLEGKSIDASVKVNSVEKMNENYDALRRLMSTHLPIMSR